MPEDITKYDIFYRPQNAPDRSYESIASFTAAESTNVPEENNEAPDISYTGRLQNLLTNLTTLLDIVDILPEGLQDTVERLTYVLAMDTIQQIEEAEYDASVESDEEETSEEEEETTDESNTAASVTTEESDEEEEEETIDDLFPTASEITMVEESLVSLVQLITNAYNDDRYGIKSEYVSKMYYSIQRYIQQMLAVTNDAGLSDFSNLLASYDASAVTVSEADLKHCHDTIARLEVLIEEECKLFDKTHSADNTLIVMRNLQSAYQQRKKYYTAEYAAEDSYLQTESNKLLAATRQVYDAQYNNAVKDTYKHFNSATQITDKVLVQTAEQAKAKGQLIENDVDVTETTSEPSAQTISNTANVVPSITAESDLNNRYGTTTSSGTTSSTSSTGTATAATLTGSSAAQQIYNFIRNNMGLSAVIACGMLGNFQQENNLSPADNEGGLGIMQLTNTRRQNCIDRYGDAAYTLAGQLSYMKDERDDSSLGESWAWDAFLSCDNSTPSSAAKNFCEKVERPGQPEVATRQSYAEGFYKIYNT